MNDNINSIAIMNDGCQLHYSYYLNQGKPVVVLSNSLGTTRQMWQEQVNVLKKHYSVLTYDARGHGDSSVTIGGYSIDRLGCDIIGLLDHLSLEKVFFCGLSIGGVMGQWLSVFYPQRIHAVVMANTSAYSGSASMWQARIKDISDSGLESTWPSVLTRWVTPYFSEKNPKIIASMFAMFESIEINGYLSTCAALRDMDMRNIARLNVLPTLVIAGTKDTAATLEDALYLESQYANSELLELEAGHLSNIEQPELFTQSVITFFNRHACNL